MAASSGPGISSAPQHSSSPLVPSTIASDSGASQKSPSGLEAIEVDLEKVIYGCRFMAFMAVLGSLIGSLPEIIGDQDNKTVVQSLEKMLEEDSAVVVDVLDSFSNLNLDNELQEQVITIALSCIRTIDAEHMPYLLRFLLLSATPSNVRRIISQIRAKLKFVGVSSNHASQQSKLKGKSRVDNTEASILDALRSSLRFKNILCQEILKDLNCLEKPQDHKVIDIWLLMLIYMNGESLQRSVEKLFKKKVIEDCIQEAMFDQCIHGHKELIQDYFLSFISLSEYLLACKEQKARHFSIHMYVCLFEELMILIQDRKFLVH